MESTDQIERRARRSYELARLWRAVAGFSPILLVVAAAALLANRPSATLAFGLSTFGVGAALLWYGRDLRRAVLPGVVAGLVPLILVLCARHVEHMCMGDACMTLCLPVCAIGGVLTGLTLAAIGLRGRHGWGFWVASSVVALLTGAMGCACVGLAGLAGLALGFGVGLVPTVAKKLFAN
ncbi:MAG TPA: hypothetical protein VHP33_06010 [Polyangiaceae bacterium]|jgi:hypothetical protein|nr:hypothetical protein [Polyangiaceae bacterium]